MYAEFTYEVVYSMPMPSKMGVAVVVPFSVARQSKLLVAVGNVMLWPAETCRQVLPPSFDKSTSMLVPLGR